MSEPAAALATPDPGRLGPLDRLLRVFGDVRAGEGATVLLMALNVFLLLVAYYILKTVREPLILLAGGAELKSYASAAQALTLIAYVPLYGWLATRLSRMWFLRVVILSLVACIQVFVVAGRAGAPNVGIVFFVWVGIFSLTTIAQFWSFANEIYTRPEGDRLFPLIAVGSAAGAWLGSEMAQRLFERGMGPYSMMQLAAGLLLVHLVLYRIVSYRTAAGRAPRAHEPMAGGNGFLLVFRSRYLMLIAGLLVLLNLVNTVGEFILSRTVLEVAEARSALVPGFDKTAFVGAFYGSYFKWVNVITVLFQAFLVSRVVKLVGIAGVILALPLVALGSYGLAAAGAGLLALRMVKTAENSTDYSFMNTAKQMLWLPTSREEKYKAKQAIDTFFVRGGDVLAAGLVFLGTQYLSASVARFARANILVVLAALAVGALLVREHRRLTATP